MIKRKIIAILTLTRDKSIEYLKRYSNYVYHDDIQLISFSLKRIRWKKKRVKAFYFADGVLKQGWFPFPDAIYNQCYNKKPIKINTYIGCHKAFNHINRFNKWQIYTILESNFELKDLLPATRLLNEANLFEFLHVKQTNVFIKPCYGSFADGIFRISFDKERNKYFIFTTNTTPKYTFDDYPFLYNKIKELVGRKTYIVQAEIPMKKLKQDLFDIRVILQKDHSGHWSITTAFCRITPYRSIITNNMYKKKFLSELLSLLDYSLEKQHYMIDKLTKSSMKMAKTLEDELGLLGQLSVDYTITNDDEFNLIEVNGKPSKNLIDELEDEQVITQFYVKPIEYLKFLANQENT